MRKRNVTLIAVLAAAQIAMSLLQFVSMEYALSTVLTLFGFGISIYFVILLCTFQGDLQKQTGKGFGAWGHFFMIIITCGIYYIYWQYAAGKRLKSLGAKDRSAVYLILFLAAVAVNIVFYVYLFKNNLVETVITNLGKQDTVLYNIVSAVTSLISYGVLIHMIHSANNLPSKEPMLPQEEIPQIMPHNT